MTAKQILKILHDDGWVKKDQKGSHLQLVHPVKRGKVTVPMHSGDLPRGTIKSILKQAGLQ
ncbi:type II toxin-antitoxin system HicA family toxin [Larkinella soli]|uniref:type II toxin-antitoxin system HicA family toxin n=1 Tax=Larkinella soli TaxID=1770527 RepID=UPI000FFC58B6|nr:type II toxin-antitoxin system HicA family toxin [Larkinella soli]